MNACIRACPPRAATFVTLLTGLALAGPVRGQDVRVYTPFDSISVGERFRLMIVAERPVWSRTVFPAPPPDTSGEVLQAGEVLLLRTVLDTSAEPDSEAGIDSVVYEATTFALDTARVGPLPVLIVSDPDTFRTASPPLLIPVRSVVPQDADDILDLMPLAEFPRPVWPWLIFLALLVLATAAFLYWYRRSPGIITLMRETAPEVKPPLQEVMERLDTLERAPLDTDAARKAFFVELSDALRTYLGRRLEIPALERTTREVIADVYALAERDEAPGDMISSARTVLETSDLAKFAEIFPDIERCRGLLRDTRSSVELVEEFLTPAPETIETEEEEHTEEKDETAAIPEAGPIERDL